MLLALGVAIHPHFKGWAEDNGWNPFIRHHYGVFQAQREDIWKQRCFLEPPKSPHLEDSVHVRADLRGTAVAWWVWTLIVGVDVWADGVWVSLSSKAWNQGHGCPRAGEVRWLGSGRRQICCPSPFLFYSGPQQIISLSLSLHIYVKLLLFLLVLVLWGTLTDTVPHTELLVGSRGQIGFPQWRWWAPLLLLASFCWITLILIERSSRGRVC